MGAVTEDATAAARAETQATFCATLVDEWARAGVGHAVVAPGSRSTPLALALAGDDRIAVHVHHDERCAAFMALGVGVATGLPAIALCTSGTAATHFHAAVVEAHHAGVPLLVCTADRPPELRDVGAPQTIDQTHLYGAAVRWFFDPGAADEAMRDVVAQHRGALGARDRAVRAPPGRCTSTCRSVSRSSARRDCCRPVGAAARRGPRGPPTRWAPPSTSRPSMAWSSWAVAVRCRPMVMAGRCSPMPCRAGPAVASATPTRCCARQPSRRSSRPTSSCGTGVHPHPAWSTSGSPARVRRELVGGTSWIDAAHTAAVVGHRAFGLSPARPGWLERWLALDDAAEAAIAAVLADHPEPTEPGTARTLLAALPDGAHLVVASSMPVRDLEWYARPRAEVTVHANRGANGIDGTMTTAIGVALATGAPTAALVGDVAFLHDSNALVGIADRGIDLTIVVVDNDGGGIFSFLPQAATLGSERFEQLFGTPHGVRPEELAAAHGLVSLTVDAADGLPLAIEASAAAGGTRLVVVRTDRAANAKLHDELNAAVAAAVRAR